MFCNAFEEVPAQLHFAALRTDLWRHQLRDSAAYEAQAAALLQPTYIHSDIVAAFSRSASDDSVPRELRGKYGAFSLQGSRGMQHLRELEAAGLTHVHLLPLYDFATVPERPEDQRTIEVGF